MAARRLRQRARDHGDARNESMTDDELLPEAEILLQTPVGGGESAMGGGCGVGRRGAQSLLEMSGADRRSVLLLTLLYVLQGIPLGLAGSVPYILSARKVTYTEQGTFSFVFWPFSLKLAWAPLVDSLYWRRFGRRKSWLIPTQLSIGAFMMLLSASCGRLLGESPPGPVAILPLTAGFFALTFLAATQDIAVDGWALTMLSRRNVSWASSCNSVGQTAGYFVAYVLFLALESADFCNAWLRSSPKPAGIVTLGDFLMFWGVVFVVTTCLLTLKREEADRDEAANADGEDEEEGEEGSQEASLGVGETYAVLWKIARLRPIWSYLAGLCLLKFSFAAADGMTGLKLIEQGVPKERLALLGVVVTPFQLMLPIVISSQIGNQPLQLYIRSTLPRLLLGLGFAGVVWITPTFKNSDAGYPLHFYLLLSVAYVVHQIFLYAMFVSQMAFHAKISDPSVGGTYMTMLNTVTNLAGNAPVTLLLFTVDWLTISDCRQGADGQRICDKWLDGYYIESAFCFAAGVAALLRLRPVFRHLESLPQRRWRVT